MNTMDFIGIRLLITELLTIAGRAGNVGRDVKRLLDRTFGGGLVLNLNKKGAQGSGLGFALYLQRLTALVEDILEPTRGLCNNFTVEMHPDLSEGWGRVSVVVRAKSAPESMRARQTLLREGAYILECFTGLEDLYLCDLVEGYFYQKQDEQNLTDEEIDTLRDRLVGYFQDFTRGDCAHASQYESLYELARLVNPSLPALNGPPEAALAA